MIKKFEDWTGDLDQFLVVEDEVDENMVDYFLNLLPPITWTKTIVQYSEAYQHINGRATYITFERREGSWFYCGDCHRGLCV